VVKFSPPKDALPILLNLLEIYWSGLSRPLPFFLLSALEYANAKLFPSQNAKASPLNKARQKWNGSWGSGEGERRDRYYDFCFPNGEPLDQEFTKLALEILEPMLRNQRYG
jgi:exodeoxyribonuclease V gamma subunit